MGGTQYHLRGRALLVGLRESQSAEAPLVAGLEAGEPELRPGRREVVAHLFRVLQEFRCQNYADGVRAAVVVPGLAAPGPVKAGQGVLAAGLQRLAKHVDLLPHGRVHCFLSVAGVHIGRATQGLALSHFFILFYYVLVHGPHYE